MTQAQAIELAKAKWGEERAYAYHETDAHPDRQYEVGTLNSVQYTPRGVGSSWEDACRKAGLL